MSGTVCVRASYLIHLGFKDSIFFTFSRVYRVKLRRPLLFHCLDGLLCKAASSCRFLFGPFIVYVPV